MKLYLYGIIDSSDQITDSIHGLEGSCVYNIPFRDIGAVVSQISQPIQNVTEGAVIEHEIVAEKLMANSTVLPVRFGTIIDGRDGLLSMMQSYYKDFKDNLVRLHNKLEFGIKVIWPADKVEANIIKVLKKDEQKTLESDNSPSKRFIEEKFKEYKIDKEFEAKADKFIKVMDIFFSKFAVEKKTEKLKTENLLMDAVYLVEKDKQNDFREAFEHIKSGPPGLKYLFSGPWPAYNFVISSKKSGLLTDSQKTALLDKVTQNQTLVGANSI
jgi:primosomal protein N''